MFKPLENRPRLKTNFSKPSPSGEVKRKAMLNQKERDLVSKLRTLDKDARKAPWSFGGQPRKGAGGQVYTIYRLQIPEENLIITMRNHISELLDIIERLEGKIGKEK